MCVFSCVYMWVRVFLVCWHARPIILQQGDQIHSTSNSRWSAGPFVMTSSVKCFSHHKTPYAVCSESIIWFCVITMATNYSYRDRQAFPRPAYPTPSLGQTTLSFHSSFQWPFQLEEIALTHHKIRKITGTTNRETNVIRHEKEGRILFHKCRFEPHMCHELFKTTSIVLLISCLYI